MSSLHAASLFAAARDEGPDAKTREAMWDRVALESGLAAGATTVAAVTGAKATAASGVSIAASKLLAIGAVIGTVSAVIGVLATLAVIEPEGASTVSAPPSVTARVVHTPRSGARLAEPASRPRDPAQVNRPSLAPTAPAALPLAAARNPDGDLAEEARLVTDARASLVGGDAIRTLALVRTARRLSSHALEPEELNLEARALRALGRADEAAAIDLTLKNRYPGHALAR